MAGLQHGLALGLAPRLSWLAPARLGFEQTHTAAALRAQLEQAAAPQLLAELQAGADACWHEVARGFAVPPGWPQEAPLSRLLEQIAGALAHEKAGPWPAFSNAALRIQCPLACAQPEISAFSSSTITSWICLWSTVIQPCC